MAGLMWLAASSRASWPFCFTFVRGCDESAVLAGFGARPGDARAGTPGGSPVEPSVRVMRVGGWIVALEVNSIPLGTSEEVLRRISAGTEAVAIFRDIAKSNHEFAHAFDGEIVTAVTTSVPAHWRGTQPERLRPLAEELGLGKGADADLMELEVLLALAEGVFGLSLDEADLGRFPPAVPIMPAAPDAARPRQVTAPNFASRAVADPGQARSHAQRLIDAGVAREVIAARAGLTTLGLSNLVSGDTPWISAITAQGILAIELPPPDSR